MTINFVLANSNCSSDSKAVSQFFFDPAATRKLLTKAADSGFDAVLIDDAGGPLTNLDIAANVAHWNPQLDVVLTHWTDVTSPAIAASDFAALDRITDGRLSLRILPGDHETDSFVGRWSRTDEYLTLLKRLWTNDRPIDHEGAFYSLKSALVADKGVRSHEMPIRMSGETGKAIDIAGRHATVFELPEPHPDQLARRIERVLTAAARYGRSEKISFSARLKATEEDSFPSHEWLSGCLAAGISEFMVSGLSSAASIERFGAEIIAPLRATTTKFDIERGGFTRARSAFR